MNDYQVWHTDSTYLLFGHTTYILHLDRVLFLFRYDLDYLNVVLLLVSKSFTWFICFSNDCYYNPCKFYTYVTKTCPNSSTYSRKLGNHNGIVIFEVDVKKSPAQWIQNSHFCNCQIQKVTSFLVLLLSVTFSVNKNKQNSQSNCEKGKFDKDFNWLGRKLFHDINLKNIGAFVIPWFYTTCG